MRQLFGWIVCGILSCAPGTAQSAIISEFMAKNASALADEDGEFSDWIEIHNPGPTAVDLAGWSLTDDATLLSRWVLPATSLPAGGHVVVFASGKNRAVSGSELHTDFRLKGGGEYLALLLPDGIGIATAFAPQFPPQRTDYSYGLVAGAVSGYGTALAYFQPATPGAFATTQGFSGFVDDAQIATPSGFHAAFSTAIATATPNATIVYTTDGSAPSPTHGTVYTTPISISRTTVLRAAAFSPGLGPSRIDTKTYVFPADVVTQSNAPAGWPAAWGGGAPAADYEMDPEVVGDPRYQQEVVQGLLEIPTLSLVMDQAHFLGEVGIYSNPTRSGRAWERPVAAELIHFDGTPGFSVECGIRVQGGASRFPNNNPKHSFSLRFRDVYGPGRLEHDVFPGSPVTSFDSLHVRSPWGHSFVGIMGLSCTNCGPFNAVAGSRERASALREVWGRAMQRAMGSADAGHGLQVNLYINGVYWGVYDLHERQDDAHYAAWHGGVEEDYDAIKAGEFVSGTPASWNRLKAIVSTRDWTAIQGALDVDNHIDYAIFNRFAGNTRISPTSNWRAAGGGPNNAPWRLYPWDLQILENVSIPRPNPSEDPSGLLETLRTMPEYVVRFGDRVHKHLFNDGALTAAQAAAQWTRLASVIDHAIVCESARWGDYRRDVHQFFAGPYALYTKYDHVVPHRQDLLQNYFPVRPGIVLAQFRNVGLYPTLSAPIFDQHGGTVPAGYQLVMSGGVGTLYYTVDGSDPRLPGGAVSPAASAYSGPVTLTSTTIVKARNQAGASWSALNEAAFVIESLIVNELLASNTFGIQDEVGEHEDWIELYNEGASPVVASGLYLTDRPTNPTKWQIPPGHTINPGGVLLIWADEDGGQGPLHANFKLARGGEVVQLYDVDGQTLLSEIQFGPQQTDVSTGWLYDGGGQLVTFLDPSPRSPNEIQGCGARRYSAQDSTNQPLVLSATGTPGLGLQVNLIMTGAPTSTVYGLFVAAGPTELTVPFSASKLLITAPIPFVNVPSGPGGIAQFALTVPPVPSLVGASLFFQDWSILGATIVASNGLEIVFCP